MFTQQNSVILNILINLAERGLFALKGLDQISVADPDTTLSHLDPEPSLETMRVLKYLQFSTELMIFCSKFFPLLLISERPN